MHGDQQRGRRRDRHAVVAQPQVVTDDAEHQQHHQRVQQHVHQVPAPRRGPADRVVEREGRQENRTQVLVLVQDGGRVRIDEEARDVAQAADVGVLLEGVPVVEVEASAEAVGVHRADDGDEEEEGRGRHPAEGPHQNSRSVMRMCSVVIVPPPDATQPHMR